MAFEHKILISSFLIALIFLSFLSLSTCDDEVEDQSEFTYDPLDTTRGPKHWGELREEWGFCNNNSMQSPIDLMDQRVQTFSNLGRFNRFYKPSNATLTNRGHDMQVRWTNDAGYIELNGTQYQLRQAHWHSPSEHSVNGQKFDMEFHLVHQSADGKNAVISILYKIGEPDSFLNTIESHLDTLEETFEVPKNIGVVNPLHVEIGTTNYYRYMGSLTTPPCTPNVSWTIVKKVRTVSREQVELIRDAVNDETESNARPLQPVNQRPVKLFRPEDQQGN